MAIEPDTHCYQCNLHHELCSLAEGMFNSIVCFRIGRLGIHIHIAGVSILGMALGSGPYGEGTTSNNELSEEDQIRREIEFLREANKVMHTLNTRLRPRVAAAYETVTSLTAQATTLAATVSELSSASNDPVPSLPPIHAASAQVSTTSRVITSCTGVHTVFELRAAHPEPDSRVCDTGTPSSNAPISMGQ